MKIEYKSNEVEFGTLKNGEVFQYHYDGDEVLWMKMISSDNDKYNAVALDDGTPSKFGYDELVTRADVKVVSA